MSDELLIVTALFGTFIALSAKALYHRHRALKMLDKLDADTLKLRASAGLTIQYQRVQGDQRFSRN